ncbi:hypothetical protein [Agrobacterium rosae]|uniref:hypothetical protein n=1 Tax=Agrobacterium rosae TaxID=1972867 RepID=UPI000CD8CA34|nr:hypothetical protein [Agrobacterium rosae]POO56167.1 hypothetical protein CTT39_05320 [Agrobacterium rosae]
MTSLRDDLSDNPPAVFLDPWLTAQGDALKQLSESVVETVERNISTQFTRQARRDAIQRRRLVVENIMANATTIALRPDIDPAHHLAVSTEKRKPTRYDRADYPQSLLAPILVALDAEGIVRRHPYVFKQRTTTVELEADLRAAIRLRGVSLSDVGRVRGAETIWLNARTGETDFRDHSPLKHRVSYRDTTESDALRSEMDRVNDFLTQADFRFTGEGQGPVALRRIFLLRSVHEAHAFNLSGRLFGGWWQDLNSNLRHLITIAGQPIADLDFSSCFANLAYVRAKGRLFEGDPYDIPGLEEHRGAAKIAMLSLLSRSSDMRRLSSELKAALPEGWTARRLVHAFSHRHPVLADSFGRDIGVELMATESRIMVALLLKLETCGIAAMGLHDGVQVAVSDKQRVIEVMHEVSERELGVPLPVTEKTIRGQLKQ